METKRCSKCGEEKPLSEFYKDSHRKDGLRCACKCCGSKYAREWYASDKGRQYIREYMRTDKAREYNRKYSAKWRAKYGKEYQRIYQRQYSRLDKVKDYRNKLYRDAVRRLADSYIVKKLKRAGFLKDQITPRPYCI